MSDFNIFYTTGRLLFGEWNKSNYQDAYSLWSNDEVTKYIGGPFADEQIEEKFHVEMKNMTEYQLSYWPLYIKSVNEKNTTSDTFSQSEQNSMEAWDMLHRREEQEDRWRQQSESAPTTNVDIDMEKYIFVGCCGFRPHDSINDIKTIEIGFHFLPSYWGRGYATEAVKGIVKYLLHNSIYNDVQKLFAGHNPQNIVCQHLLTEKLMFKAIGTEYYAPTGLMHPSYTLDLDRRSMV